MTAVEDHIDRRPSTVRPELRLNFRVGGAGLPGTSSSETDVPDERSSFMGAAAFAIGIFVLGTTAVWLAPPNSEVAAWWPAAGLGTAYVTARYRDQRLLLLLILVASGLANLAGGRPVGISVGFAISNTVEAAIVAFILNRGVSEGHRPLLRRRSDMLKLVAAAAAGAVAIAVGVVVTLGLAGAADPSAAFRSVLASHGTAVLLITPFAMSVPPSNRRGRVEYVLLWCLSLGGVVVVFAPGQSLPFAFIVPVCLMWTASRLGLRATALQLIVVGVLTSVLTGRGGGQFADLGGSSSSTSAALTNSAVQVFLLANAVMLFTLALAVGERERAVAGLRSSELLYRTGFTEAIVGMMIVRFDRGKTRLVSANHASMTTLGVTGGDDIELGFETADGTTLADVAADLAPGRGWGGEMSVEAESRWFDIAIVRLSDIDAASPVFSVQFIETTDRHRAESELELMARSDSLTGLANRSQLCTWLTDRLSQEPDRPVTVLLLDIDEFKVINDSHGHRVGDRLLQTLAGRLLMMAPEAQMVARLGGDEFVLAIEGLDPAGACEVLSDRLRGLSSTPIEVDDITCPVHLSGGFTHSRSGVTVDQLLMEADIALYEAKESGKRRVAEYTEHLGRAAADRTSIEAELRVAIRQAEFRMYMQPVIDLRTDAIVAAEALIRWPDGNGGVRPPGQWLDIAERAGLLPEIGAFVLDDSLRQATRWRSVTGPERMPVVHVNVSARQLDEPGFADLVRSAIERHRFPADKLVLELTETQLARVRPAMVAELCELDRMGIGIAADDFGTGYSPLTRIFDLPVSMIKIDRRFISHMADDERYHGIVESLVHLGTRLGMEVVAEGIETESELDALRRLGCPAAQGFFWSRPVSEADFRAMLGEPRVALAPRLGALPGSRRSGEPYQHVH